VGRLYIFPTLDAFLNGAADIPHKQSQGSSQGLSSARPEYSVLIQDHWTLPQQHLRMNVRASRDSEHLPSSIQAEHTNDFAPIIGLAYRPSPDVVYLSWVRLRSLTLPLPPANSALERRSTCVEQVADGKSTQTFHSELGGSAGSPIPSISSVDRSPPTQHLQPSRSRIASAGVEHLITNYLTQAHVSCLHTAEVLFSDSQGEPSPPVLLTLAQRCQPGIPNSPLPPSNWECLCFPPTTLISVRWHFITGNPPFGL